MVSKLVKKRLFSPFLQRFAQYYFSKPRTYSYKHIKGTILPGVFYPLFTISTKLLLTFVDTQHLKDKHFLELGCGTGFISVLAAKKGANVVASDINPEAIKNATLNAQQNQVTIKTILSDLFANIPQQVFDYIVINPPYYPKNPSNKAEEAWFCGENFDYFRKLFKEVGNYFSETSKVLMILSEDCEIEQIKSIAKDNGLFFVLVEEKVRQVEKNYLYQISYRIPNLNQD